VASSAVLPRVTILAVLAAVLAVAGCGGSGGSGGSTATRAVSGNERDQIVSAISTSVTSTDPGDCIKLETQRFLEQIHFTKGADAIKACRQDAPDTSDDPDSVDVTGVQANGARATANVAFHGGSFDGSTLSVALTRDGDQWKMDQITAVPTFDLPAFEKAFTARLGSQQHVPAAGIDCITSSLDSAGPDVVKQALISGDASQLLNLIGSCLSGAAGA
jgi:hypothetical protein